MCSLASFEAELSSCARPYVASMHMRAPCGSRNPILPPLLGSERRAREPPDARALKATRPTWIASSVRASVAANKLLLLLLSITPPPPESLCAALESSHNAQHDTALADLRNRRNAVAAATHQPICLPFVVVVVVVTLVARNVTERACGRSAHTHTDYLE